MAQSYVTFTGNGSSTGPITLGFNYILKSHVKVYENRDILLGTGTLKTETTHYTFNTAGTQISMVTAPANGVVITVERETPNDDQIVAYADGSNLIADSLNNADKQTLFATQELEDRQALAAAKALAAKSEAETATTNVATLTANPIFSGNFGSTSISTTANLTVSGDVVANGNIYSSDSDWLIVTDNVSVNGHITIPDNKEVRVGNSSDIRIFHDQSNSIINNNGTGDLLFTSTFDVTCLQVVRRTNLWQEHVALLYDGNTKLKTINTGIEVTGVTDTDTLTVSGTATINTVSADNISGSAVVTSGTSSSDTKVYSAKRCDELYYNLASTEEIQSGETWVAADNKVATTAAIDARIVDLVDDVGGFVPIANETSFPNANPDVNNGAGTLVSVPLANTLTSNAGGYIYITNGTLGNSQVTIVGAGISKTYAAGFGIIVETTTTLNQYVFHRYVPKATEVTTVATNISNINAVVSNQTNINQCATNSNIDVVANNIANVTKVAAIDGDVTTVAGDAADIGACATNIGSIAAIGADLSNNYSNIITYGSITDNVTDTSGTSHISTLASGSNLTNIATVSGISANVTTVAGISANVTSVAGNATNINSAASNASNINTCATNISAITDAPTQAANAATSATSAASSATTATTQASIATTQATNAAASASTANTYQLAAKQWRDDASGIKTQAESNVYNLSDSVSSHTAWGNVTDVGTTHFSSESGNVLLTMSKGSAVYDYGAVA